ncbi:MULTISPECIES: hypothetical protein [unclassified Streptomyces]|uniref:hypothetical protein n=1 Tax=unclassified Streptomyces TaxID=2593676 RepID=UPI000DC799DC|nr:MULTISPECIES: hypothetical protein [unclassified Streptomyces]AWZ07118.1 hypothetical protein DRB89_23625 [Streptomyces sp. ICC4]AWZ14879.1 hypothetical protein DRB96_24405 [Streptomyces sp. ICC1]
MPSDRYDAWAAAPPAGKLLSLLAAWAVVPAVLSHWPDPDETPVALISPQAQVRVYTAHVLESLEHYRLAVVAHAAAADPSAGAPDRGADGSAAAREARSRVLSLVSGVLADVCHDRLIVPELAWEDLPEDRRTVPSRATRRQTVWQAAAAV